MTLIVEILFMLPMKALIKFVAAASLLLAANPVAAHHVECIGDLVLGELTEHAHCFKDGELHGRWEVRYADGDVATGPYVNGKQHGQWEYRHADGGIDTGPMVDGNRHGRWEVRPAKGPVEIGSYVNGKRHGLWEDHWGRGIVSCNTFKNGEYVDAGPCPKEHIITSSPSATDLPVATNPAAAVFDSVWRSVVYIADDDGQGSGVIVGRDTVATNCHVVTANKIGVFPPATREATADKSIRARIIRRDKKRDFCVLRVGGVGGRIAKIRKFSTLKIGEAVYAIGAPEGQELTLSDGLISQLRNRDGRRLIQTNAAISHGSSGGGLFDANGNLIGITTAVITEDFAANIGFAIPAELALGK